MQERTSLLVNVVDNLALNKIHITATDIVYMSFNRVQIIPTVCLPLYTKLPSPPRKPCSASAELKISKLVKVA